MDEFQKKFRQTEPNSPARIATQSVAGGSQLTLKLRHKFPKINPFDKLRAGRQILSILLII